MLFRLGFDDYSFINERWLRDRKRSPSLNEWEAIKEAEHKIFDLFPDILVEQYGASNVKVVYPVEPLVECDVAESTILEMLASEHAEPDGLTYSYENWDAEKPGPATDSAWNLLNEHLDSMTIYLESDFPKSLVRAHKTFQK
jgi:hypothetical protein